MNLAGVENPVAPGGAVRTVVQTEAHFAAAIDAFAARGLGDRYRQRAEAGRALKSIAHVASVTHLAVLQQLIAGHADVAAIVQSRTQRDAAGRTRRVSRGHGAGLDKSAHARRAGLSLRTVANVGRAADLA